MSKWAREKRRGGKEVKVGYRRVRVEGKWRNQEDVEKELEKERSKTVSRKTTNNNNNNKKDDKGKAEVSEERNF